MKNFKYLIALLVVVLSLTTVAFAYTANDAVVTGATLDGTTIEYDPANEDGFTFSIVATGDVKLANYTIVTSGLTGWTIEQVDGSYSDGAGDQSFAGGKLLAKYANNAAGHGAAGTAVVKFKAVPGAGATIDGASFTVAATVMPVSGAMYNNATNPVVYTLAEAAAAQEEVVDATVVEENADAVVYGAENSYWGVWVGTYKVALNGKTLQSAVVTFEGVDGKSFPTQNTNWVEGEGEATFKIAIIGVPDEYADKSVAKATLK